MAEITGGAAVTVELLKEEAVRVLLTGLGFILHSLSFSPFCSLLPQIPSACTRSAVLDFQLGENVFLAKLALPQEIFPQSVFWAHPGYGWGVLQVSRFKGLEGSVPVQGRPLIKRFR